MEPIDDRNVEDMNLTTRQDNSLNPSVRADNTGVLILLIRSRKEAQLWFSSILSIAMFLFVFGIVTNGVICFVMLPGKRYKKNTSNFYILHLSVRDLVSRLLISPIVMYSVVTASKIESIQCKFLYLFSNTFASGTFVSLAAIATDRYQNIVYPMRALKTKKTTPLHQVFLVWSYAILVSIPSVVSVQSIAIYETPEAQGMDCENCTDMEICDIPQNAMGQVSTTSYFVFAFLAPLTLIFVLYSKIAFVLHQRSSNGIMHKVAARSKSKAVRMLVLAVFGYALSLGPASLFVMLRSYGTFNNSSFHILFVVSWMVQILSLTSSVGNPIIYAYYNGDFRNEVLKQFCRSSTKCSAPSTSVQNPSR